MAWKLTLEPELVAALRDEELSAFDKATTGAQPTPTAQPAPAPPVKAPAVRARTPAPVQVRTPAPTPTPAPAAAQPEVSPEFATFDAAVQDAVQAEPPNPYDVQDWKTLTSEQARQRLQAIPAYDAEKQATYNALPWYQKLVTAPPPGMHPNIRESTLQHLQDIAVRDQEPPAGSMEPHWLLDPPQMLANMYPQAGLMALGAASKPLGRAVKAGTESLLESGPAKLVGEWLRPYGEAASTISQALTDTPVGQAVSRWTSQAGRALRELHGQVAPTFLRPDAKEASYPIRHYSAETRLQGLRNQVQMRDGLRQAEEKLQEMEQAWHDAWVARHGTEPDEAAFPSVVQRWSKPSTDLPLPVPPLWGGEGRFKWGYIPDPVIPAAERASWFEYAMQQGYKPPTGGPNGYPALLKNRENLRALRHTMPTVPTPADLAREKGLILAISQQEKYLAEAAYQFMMHRKPLDARVQDYVPEHHKPLPFQVTDVDPILNPPASLPLPSSAAVSTTEPFWLTRQEAEQAFELAKKQGFTPATKTQEALLAHQETMDRVWQDLSAPGGPEAGVERRFQEMLREEDRLTREAGQDALTWLLDHGTQPPAQGMKRLYRGESTLPTRQPAEWITQSQNYQETMQASGRWWTDDPAIAQWYVSDAGPTSRMLYIDVPENVAQAAHLPNQPADVQRFSRDTTKEYFLPEAYRGQGQPYNQVPQDLLDQHPWARRMRNESLPAHSPGYRGTPYPSHRNTQLHFYDSMEHGLDKYSPDLEKQLQAKLQDAYAELAKLPKAVQDDFLWNYWPSFWGDKGHAERLLEEIAENTHIPQSYRQRLLTSNVEAMQSGLNPRSSNPVQHILGELHVYDNFFMIHKALKAQEQLGLVRYVSPGEAIPESWVQLPRHVGQTLSYETGKVAVDRAGAGVREDTRWYAPEDVAKVWQNWASQGLRNSDFYDFLRQRSNAMIMFRLGLSGFHALAESLYTMTSDLSLGLMQVSEGRFAQGTQSFGRGMTPYAVKAAFSEGRQLMQEAMFPGAMPAEMQEMVTQLTKGGMDFQRSAAYGTKLTAAGQMWQKMQANPFLSIVEKISEPLMGKFVPAVKLAAAARLAEEELARLGPAATEQQIRTAMARVVDSIDNRFGLLAYDNLFWNRSLKDLSHLMVQSVGWNLGSMREAAGGVFDLGKVLSGSDPVLSSRTAFVMSLPFLTGLYGGMMHYLMTGERPQELKDYYFPKTGRRQGRYEERVKLPTYMYDATHIAHGIASKSDLLGWMGGKMNPMLVTTYELVRNQDFFGLPIRGEHGTKPAAAVDKMLERFPAEVRDQLRALYQNIAFLADAYMPYSVGQAARGYRHEDWPLTIGGMLGITGAPGWLQRSPGQERRQESQEGQRIDRQRRRLENR